MASAAPLHRAQKWAPYCQSRHSVLSRCNTCHSGTPRHIERQFPDLSRIRVCRSLRCSSGTCHRSSSYCRSPLRQCLARRSAMGDTRLPPPAGPREPLHRERIASRPGNRRQSCTSRDRRTAQDRCRRNHRTSPHHRNVSSSTSGYTCTIHTPT